MDLSTLFYKTLKYCPDTWADVIISPLVDVIVTPLIHVTIPSDENDIKNINTEHCFEVIKIVFLPSLATLISPSTPCL